MPWMTIALGLLIAFIAYVIWTSIREMRRYVRDVSEAEADSARLHELLEGQQQRFDRELIDDLHQRQHVPLPALGQRR